MKSSTDADKSTSISGLVKAELPAYEQASVIYDQIFALQEFIMKIAEVFLPVAGAAWVAATSNLLGLPKWGRIAICLLIAVAGVQICIIYWGALRSIRGRFRMVDAIGEKAFPTILGVGQRGFPSAVRWATWGKERNDLFWYFIPGAGILGSLILAGLLWTGQIEIKNDAGPASSPVQRQN